MEQRENASKTQLEGVIKLPLKLSESAEAWAQNTNPDLGITQIIANIQKWEADLENLKTPDFAVPHEYNYLFSGSVDDIRDLAQKSVSSRLATQETKLIKKHEEKYWALNVFGNAELSAQDKLDQLPVFKDWLLVWKDYPELIKQGPLNFLPQKLAPIIYEVVSSSTQETGVIPAEFTDFIYELGQQVKDEVGDEYSKDGAKPKFAIASSFIRSFATHFFDEVELIAELEDKSKAKTRTEALVKIANFFIDNGIKNAYNQRQVRAEGPGWWYKTVVRGKHFSNPVLLNEFLNRIDQGKQVLLFNPNSSEIHDEAVNCTLKVLDLVKDDPTRNTEFASDIHSKIVELSLGAKKGTRPGRPVVVEDIVRVSNQLVTILNRMNQTGEDRVVFSKFERVSVDSLPIALLRILVATRNGDHYEKQQAQDIKYFNLVSYLSSVGNEALEAEYLKRIEARKQEIGLMLGRVATTVSGRLIISNTVGSKKPFKPGYGKLS